MSYVQCLFQLRVAVDELLRATATKKQPKPTKTNQKLEHVSFIPHSANISNVIQDSNSNFNHKESKRLFSQVSTVKLKTTYYGNYGRLDLLDIMF